MIRIDAYFLYQVGAAIRPLVGLERTASRTDARSILYPASHWLDTLLNKSVYTLQTCVLNGRALLGTIKSVLNDFNKPGVDLSSEIDFIDYYLITTQAQAFETVLAAELQWGQLYLAQPKGGYDLMQLAENGTVIFPKDLAAKTPSAIVDAKEAARCIAFELSTAAAFHLHRVNEIVLRAYYDQVTGGKPHPETRSIRSYIDAMKCHQVGDKIVFGALSTLNNLHRNPVIHPEQRLESVEEAIALLGTVHTTVAYMLKSLPPPELKLVSPPSDEKDQRAIVQAAEGQ